MLHSHSQGVNRAYKLFSKVSLHSSNEPGELSQWLCHDDSTINIILVIIIIIIIYLTLRSAGTAPPVRHQQGYNAYRVCSV